MLLTPSRRPDSHRHVLEDGGMKQTDWAQLGFKRRVDPGGLLNPGKMRAWEEPGRGIRIMDTGIKMDVCCQKWELCGLL